MRLEHLEYLVEISRYKSISQAARHLYITQPSLSAAVSGIERELGYPLFKRTKQGVVPTAKGELVIADAREMLRRYRGWLEPDETDAAVQGEVRVIGTPGVCKSFMTDIIAELRDKYPKISIHLDEVKKLEFFDRLQSGAASIGLSSFIPAEREMYEAALKRNDWRMDILFEDVHRCIISSRNPRAGQDIITREQLKNMTFCTFTDDVDLTTEMIISYLPPETKKLRVNSDSVIWQLVAKDMAVSVGPTSCLYENYYLSLGIIKYIKLEGYDHSAFHNIIYPASEHLTLAEQKFVECAESYYARLVPFEGE